jgi:GT2 family glycosyltransferase
MCTYNRADRLGRAINSVLGQTFDDFELIVVDDGSWITDDDSVTANSRARLVVANGTSRPAGVAGTSDRAPTPLGLPHRVSARSRRARRGGPSGHERRPRCRAAGAGCAATGGPEHGRQQP